MRDTKKAREYNRLWYLRNRDRVSAMNAEYAQRPEVKARRAALHQEAMSDPVRRAAIQEAAKARYHRDGEKRRARSRELDAANPDRVRNKSLRRMYGLTLQQVEQMRIDQNGECSICCSVLLTNKGAGQRYHVDHCHESGKVRALLCSLCNQGLGGFRDNPEWMRRAALYIERFR